MAFIYDLADTWNAAGTTFTAIKMNVTDTASAAGSLLMDLQVGGVSRFRISKTGAITADSGITTQGSATINGNINLPIANNLNWGGDTLLTRDAANTLAQRNGVNAQAFRVYNTFTDASNYERAKITWASNVLQIGTEKAGTGTARALEFQTDGVTRLTIGTTGTVSIGTFALSQTGATFSDWGGTFGYTSGSAYTHDGNRNLILLLSPSGQQIVKIGGATASFPALKRSTTSLQARLADDSAFTNIQGKLTTDTAYTAGSIAPTGYLTLYDSTGTAYRVPCVV